MKSTITILLLSLLPLSLLAQGVGEKTYVVGGGQQNTAQRKDTADAVYEDIRHEYVLQSDGSVVHTYSHKLRLLTNFAFTRAYGESFITYNPQWQTLEVLRSVTTMGDGNKVESPFNAYNEVLPGYAAGSAPHLGLKEMVVTHVGVEAGAVIDFSYRLTTKPGMMPGLMDRVVFGARSPINKLTVIVSVPENIALEHFCVRDDMTPRKENANGMRLHTWVRTEIPMVDAEESQPALDDFLPVLYFTTGTKAGMISHCLQDAGDTDLGPAKAAVDEIVGKESDPVRRATALQRWVLDRVGRMGGPLDIVGFRATSPAATLRANTGSDLDRAVLLAAMCRAAGIDAAPVLFSKDVRSEGLLIESKEMNGHRIDSFHADGRPDLSSLPLYSQPAVVCRAVGPYAMLALDAAHAQNGPMDPNYLGRFFIELKEGTERPLQYQPIAVLGPSVSAVTSDWTLGEDLTVKGKSSVSSSGIRSYAFDPDGMKGVVKRTISAAGQGMKVEPGTTDVRASAETVCEADVVSDKALVVVEGVAEFRLPVAPGGVSELRLPMGDLVRRTPVAMPGTLREEQRLTLHLPKNVRAVAVPSMVEISNPVGSVRSVIKADAHDIEVTRVIEITDAKLDSQAYPPLLELLRAWHHPAHTTLQLRVQN